MQLSIYFVYFSDMILSNKKIIQGNWSLNIIQCVLAHLTRWELTDGSAPFWRLYANFSPDQWLFFRDMKVELNRENLVLLPPETGYKGILKGTEAYHLFIHFTLNHPISPVKPGCYPLERTPYHHSLLKPIENYLREGNEAGDLSGTALALTSSALSALSPLVKSRPPRDERVERVREIMEEHLQEDLGMDDLAALVNLSTGGLTRLFKEALGLSPLAFLNSRRISRACELLHNRDLSIEDIAERCGFANRYYFSRVFRKYRSNTPAAFRKMIT